jgi:hypothetical protein
MSARTWGDSTADVSTRPEEPVDLFLALPVLARLTEDCREPRTVLSPSGDDLCVGAEDRLEHALRIVCCVAHRGQLLEAGIDLPLVPGHEDGLDVGEVLVDRGPGDACGHSDLGHGRGPEPALVVT